MLAHTLPGREVREGGKEGGKVTGRKGGREEMREGGKEGRRVEPTDGGREGRREKREGGRKGRGEERREGEEGGTGRMVTAWPHIYIQQPEDPDWGVAAQGWCCLRFCC